MLVTTIGVESLLLVSMSSFVNDANVILGIGDSDGDVVRLTPVALRSTSAPSAAPAAVDSKVILNLAAYACYVTTKEWMFT